MGIGNDFSSLPTDGRRNVIVNTLKSKALCTLTLFVEDNNELCTFLGEAKIKLIDIPINGTKRERKYKKTENQELTYNAIVFKNRGVFESGLTTIDLGIDYEAWIFPGTFFLDIELTRQEVRQLEDEDETSKKIMAIFDENIKKANELICNLPEYNSRFFVFNDQPFFVTDQYGQKRLLSSLLSKLTIKTEKVDQLNEQDIQKLIKEYISKK